MAWPPNVADFKAKFVRPFVYGDGLDTVTNGDITSALADVPQYFNPALLDSPSLQNSAYLNVAAHIMVLNIQTAGGLSAVKRGLGVRNVSENNTISKGLGQANVSYDQPPERIRFSPTLSYLWRTTFGQTYLAMISQHLIGNMAVVEGPNPNQWSNE